MALWVDRHHPTCLSECELHPEINRRLTSLARVPNVPHLLFHGPSGAGKRTRIVGFLTELFGPDVQRVKVEQREIETKKGSVTVNVLSSAWHIELNPSDAGAQDKHVIQHFFTEVAEHASVAAVAPAAPFKIIVLNEADQLSFDAQAALRRTMEKYSYQCRVILCCERLSRVIAPIQSRCLLVRVPAPPVEELVPILVGVALAHDAPESAATASVAEAVVKQADGDLRVAMLLLQERALIGDKVGDIKVSDKDEKSTAPVATTPVGEAVTDWQAILRAAVSTLKSHSLAALVSARDALIDVLNAGVPADMLLECLADAMYTAAGTQTHAVAEMVAHCDVQMAKGGSGGAYFHLDALLATFAALLADKS